MDEKFKTFMHYAKEALTGFGLGCVQFEEIEGSFLMRVVAPNGKNCGTITVTTHVIPDTPEQIEELAQAKAKDVANAAAKDPSYLWKEEPKNV